MASFVLPAAPSREALGTLSSLGPRSGRRCSCSSTRASKRKSLLVAMVGSNPERFHRDVGRAEEDVFPKHIQEALHQAGDSIEAALDDGLYRLRIQLNAREFDLRHGEYQDTLVPSFVNLAAKTLTERGLRVNFMFNTLFDASQATSLLDEHYHDNVSINVLGLGEFSADFDIAVLVCPSNEGNENLQRIEAVERVLYQGPPKTMLSKLDRKRFMQRPIILFNPVLEAIHPSSNDVRKVVPMFMRDFAVVYFLDPHIISSQSSDAALFKKHPSRWQLWVRSNNADYGNVEPTDPTQPYRKVWEQTGPGSNSGMYALISHGLQKLYDFERSTRV